jgi:hypothetical protein
VTFETCTRQIAWQMAGSDHIETRVDNLSPLQVYNNHAQTADEVCAPDIMKDSFIDVRDEQAQTYEAEAHNAVTPSPAEYYLIFVILSYLVMINHFSKQLLPSYYSSNSKVDPIIACLYCRMIEIPAGVEVADLDTATSLAPQSGEVTYKAIFLRFVWLGCVLSTLPCFPFGCPFSHA